MIDGVLLVLVVMAALGCGLMSGAFFAFSAFVMSGLEELPPSRGAAAMQAINVKAVTPAFMIAFFGTAVACVVVSAWTAVDWAGAASVWVLVGAALYVLGVFVMTAAYHVPRNDRLAAVDPETDGGIAEWRRYLSAWTRGNHLRTAAALAAAAALTIAVRVG